LDWGKAARPPVGRRDEHHDLVAGADVLAAQGEVLDHHACGDAAAINR
jgi:hypothetical protein